MAEQKIYEISKPDFKSGRPRSFDTAEEFYDKCVEYLRYVDGNPWIDRQASNGMSTNGENTNNSTHQSARPIQLPYTKQGFMAYCALGSKYNDFRATNCNRDGFLAVFEWFEDIIENQQLSGAMIGKFNGNIVSRLNGYADKVVNEVTGKDGEPFMLPTLSSEDIKALQKINGV